MKNLINLSQTLSWKLSSQQKLKSSQTRDMFCPPTTTATLCEQQMKTVEVMEQVLQNLTPNKMSTNSQTHTRMLNEKSAEQVCVSVCVCTTSPLSIMQTSSDI